MLSGNSSYLQMLKRPLNLSLKKGFCNTVKDMAAFYRHFPHLINESLQIILQMSDTISLLTVNNGGVPLLSDTQSENLQVLYVDAIMDLCQHNPESIGEQEFGLLRHHLTTQAAGLKVKNTSKLMEALCCVCSH